MNAGETMLRVYATLRDRVASGEFRPGERLDPGRLASQLSASVTPVRDALHRLTGEGLVESWQQEGFRQPQLSEAALRDLYEWGQDLVLLVARAGFRHGMRPGNQIDAAPYPERVAAVLRRIALASPNEEHRGAIADLVDRSWRYRTAELVAVHEAASDLEALAKGVDEADWPALRAAIEAFHRRRIRNVVAIVAALRAAG